MANEQRGEVDLEIGGMQRTLRFDMNSMAELESNLGKPIGEIFKEGQVGIKEIREALYVGLKWRYRKIQRHEVGSWMVANKLGEFGAAIGRAIAMALGEDPDALLAEDQDDPLPVSDDPPWQDEMPPDSTGGSSQSSPT